MRPHGRRTGLVRGRVCLVTGGGSGIGRATALRMAAEGAAAVVVAGRRERECAETADRCRGLGARALHVGTDVTREDQVVRLVEQTLDVFGRVDVAFDNAGLQERRRPLADQPPEVYDAVFDTNVRGLFFCLKHQLAAMQGQDGGGCIVVNASVSGVRNPNPGLALYSASKAAAISLTRSVAMEYAPLGIRVNAVAPGRVLTEMMLASGIDVSQVAAALPLRRMGRAEEVAQAVVWLASDEASYVVGHVLHADGGFLAG